MSGGRVSEVLDGTDCALRKKYTARALARDFAERGVDVDFRATRQTGITISGSGIPMDAVIADFAAGAAEMLTQAAHQLGYLAARHPGRASTARRRERAARMAGGGPDARRCGAAWNHCRYVWSRKEYV
jgi:hypothetical protein